MIPRLARSSRRAADGKLRAFGDLSGLTPRARNTNDNFGANFSIKKRSTPRENSIEEFTDKDNQYVKTHKTLETTVIQ